MDKNNVEDSPSSGSKQRTSDVDEALTKAHDIAERDIEKDPDLQTDPTDDLDEGELARLEGED